MEFPARDEVMAWPIERFAAIAPQTLLYAPGGTRRQAVLAGIRPDADAYAAWSRQQMLRSIEQLFRFGAKHTIINVLRPAQVAEVGRYRERLYSWLREGLGGDEALADYQARGWRVRLIGATGVAELAALAERLHTYASPATYQHTAWFYACASIDSIFVEIAKAIAGTQAATQAELIAAMYGEAIPPATLLLGFGKPIVAFDMIPPLLAGEIQAYWTQRPGFDLPEQDLRRIWYDYGFTRRTWQADKTSRYESVEADRPLWERGPATILGVGTRLASGFWHPHGQEE